MSQMGNLDVCELANEYGLLPWQSEQWGPLDTLGIYAPGGVMVWSRNNSTGTV